MVFDSIKRAIFDIESKNPSMSDFIKTGSQTSSSVPSKKDIETFELPKNSESVDRNGLNIPNIDDLYDNYKDCPVKFSDKTVYKVEEFYKTLESVPKDMRTSILLGIIKTSGLNVDDLKQEALIRKDVLNDMLVKFRDEKAIKIEDLNLTNKELEKKIEENEINIKKNEDELSGFSADVFSEITRIDNILEYMNSGE